MDDNITIQDTLRSWGRAVRIGRAPNDFPHCTPFARFILNPGEGAAKASRPQPLPDDYHAAVDSAVSSMRPIKPGHYEVICRAYISGQLDHKIAEAMRCSRSHVRTLREAGEAWVESRLHI